MYDINSEYLIIKYKDIESSITRVTKEESNAVLGMIKFLTKEVGYTRYLQGKTPKKYIVIEEGEEKYDEVLKLISEGSTGTSS